MNNDATRTITLDDVFQHVGGLRAEVGALRELVERAISDRLESREGHRRISERVRRLERLHETALDELPPEEHAHG